MRYEPSSEVRQAAAMRLMERVDRLMKAERIEHVPVPGDPPPGRSVLAERERFEEQLVLGMASGGPLRVYGSEQANLFCQAKYVDPKKKTMVPRAVIMRLIDKGFMRWINNSRTAVELVRDE
jgi:hypothetical protein